MRNISIAIIFCLIPFLSQANPLITGLQKTYRNAQSWNAQFEQRTFVELLGREIKKKGFISVKKPGKLRIEYKTEPAKTYISNGKKLWIYFEGDNQVQVYRKASKIVAKEALAFLHGLGNIEKEFRVTAVNSKAAKESRIQNPKLKLMELQPRNRNSLFKKIILGLDPKYYMVHELTLFNSSGNRTHYMFKGIKLDVELGDELFNFKKPKGVREVKGVF